MFFLTFYEMLQTISVRNDDPKRLKENPEFQKYQMWTILLNFQYHTLDFQDHIRIGTERVCYWKYVLIFQLAFF